MDERGGILIPTEESGTDFDRFCDSYGLEYGNPVPIAVLKRFQEENKTPSSTQILFA